MATQIAPKSFTLEFHGIARVLRTPVKITPQFDASITPIQLGPGMRLDLPRSDPNEFIAIWDTGATNTCVTPNVLSSVPLPPIGMTQCSDPSGGRPRTVYLGCLYLPNGFFFERTQIVGVDSVSGADMLIGMDIIGRGDFAVTSAGGKTIFSFRFPSQEKIDFLKGSKTIVSGGKKVGRNEPCPCGSGKKYKKCHGK